MAEERPNGGAADGDAEDVNDDSSARGGAEDDAGDVSGDVRATGAGLFVSRDARRDAVVRAVALAVGAVAVSLAVVVAVPEATDPAWIRARLAGLGAFAPVAFVALHALQVVVAPVPGQVLGGVAGYLFGTVGGTVYSLLGVAVGSAVVFAGSRRFGRPYVERVVAPDRLAEWDDFVEDRGALGLFVLFLFPAFPDDLLCFVAGLSEVRLRTLLALVVVGRAPSFLAASYAGTSLASGRLGAFAGVVVAIAAASLLVYAARERILDGLDRTV